MSIEHESSLLPYFYLQDSVFNAEKNIFKNEWIAVGRLDQLHEEGSYFSVELLDEPIIVTKSKDDYPTKSKGNIHALSNVCRHRGSTLAKDGECGKKEKLVCPYHGWTYSLNGSLLGCTEFEGVKCFNKKDNRLPEYYVNILDPLIFVNLSDNPLAFGFDKISIPPVSFYERRSYTINCNWKVFVDNYLDGGYHINHAHKSLAKSVNYSEYVTKIEDKVVTQSAPLNQSNDLRQGEAKYIWIWPNLMINISEGIMDTNLVLPISKDKCKVVFDFYFDFKKVDLQKRHESIVLSELIQQEDIDLCERVQKGMGSNKYKGGRYSVKREIGIYHFHQILLSKYYNLLGSERII